MSLTLKTVYRVVVSDDAFDTKVVYHIVADTFDEACANGRELRRAECLQIASRPAEGPANLRADDEKAIARWNLAAATVRLVACQLSDHSVYA